MCTLSDVLDSSEIGEPLSNLIQAEGGQWWKANQILEVLKIVFLIIQDYLVERVAVMIVLSQSGKPLYFCQWVFHNQIENGGV